MIRVNNLAIFNLKKNKIFKKLFNIFIYYNTIKIFSILFGKIKPKVVPLSKSEIKKSNNSS